MYFSKEIEVKIGLLCMVIVVKRIPITTHWLPLRYI